MKNIIALGCKLKLLFDYFATVTYSNCFTVVLMR
jgi:hypothetical protein